MNRVPQKTHGYDLDESFVDNFETIPIEKHAEMVQEITYEQFSKKDLEMIKQNVLAPELLPAVNKPTEIQDLRKIERAQTYDIREWIDTAVDILPEISTEI